jgi:predicted RNA-binding Zn-ribbon protein involved in translation (DUF1610 family)
MAMLNFDAYNGKELQHFMSMLNQCESNGILDIRFVRERLQKHIDIRFRENRKYKVKKIEQSAITNENKQVIESNCPECGDSGWRLVKREGVSYYACPKCRLSIEVK